MASEKPSVILTWDPRLKDLPFDAVLDMTCERLREKHIQFTIRRIREMDEELMKLEEELDDLMRLHPAQCSINILKKNNG